MAKVPWKSPGPRQPLRPPTAPETASPLRAALCSGPRESPRSLDVEDGATAWRAFCCLPQRRRSPTPVTPPGPAPRPHLCTHTAEPITGGHRPHAASTDRPHTYATRSQATCAAAIDLASHLPLAHLMASAQKLALAAFVDVSGSDTFHLLPLVRLEALLAHDELCAKEELVFDGLLRWIDKQPTPPTEEEEARLLQHVRFPLMKGHDFVRDQAGPACSRLQPACNPPAARLQPACSPPAARLQPAYSPPAARLQPTSTCM